MHADHPLLCYARSQSRGIDTFRVRSRELSAQ
jgi:hypothetical protein